MKKHAHDRASPSPEDIVTFDDPSVYARSIRATALVFADARSREIQERIQRLSPSDVTVLIVGETGTGKELVARQLHRLSPRAAAPFLAVNCAALPEHLVESELFGHEKGAFTGADAQKKGWFEAASGGTLFLDEVGDLPPTTQVKILRALQEREITRVGSRSPITVDIRFLAATNVNLEDAVRAGRFREDLYYRLNVARLDLPPLRERKGDVLPLVEYFSQLYQVRLGLSAVALSPAAAQTLLDYPWPGNIRELENVVHHALLVMRGNIMQPQDLNLTGYRLVRQDQPLPRAEPLAMPSPGSTAGGPLSQVLIEIFRSGRPDIYASIEEQVLRTAFGYCDQNQVKTAKLLGVSRNIIRHRLKHHNLI